jgi:glycosyltransferase involved in cell wall biosynthesis
MRRRRPRICMVTHSAFPADPRVAREVRAALAAGFAVDVVATRGPGEAAREEVGGATVHRLPVTHERGGGPLRTLIEYVGFTVLATVRVAGLALRWRYRVVQVHNPPDFLMVSAVVPKLLGARVVFDLHDLSSDMFSMRFGAARGAAIAERLLRWTERLACRMADLVITVHEPYRSELATRGVPLEKSVVVLNSVDEVLLPAGRPGSTRPPFRIVYHGTVTPHYGLDVLVEAFSMVSDDVPDATLQIYGEGDAVSQLAARAAALGVAGEVEVTGVSLAQAEVLKRVQGASVGVVPNLPTPLNRFALSTKLFEYVVLGIPVVAADLPTIRSHFAEHEIVCFRAGDARSLADALRLVAGDPEAASARAQAARARYDAMYAWNGQASIYTQALMQLAGSEDVTGG